MESVGWGILGTGDIAGLVAEDLDRIPGARLSAVGSRSEERARRFAHRFGDPRPHGSYEALVSDPSVELVYVATPHPFHREHTLLGLEAGKAVLCEKPFAVRAAGAREMISAARSRGLFLMEAMWTRFLPVLERVREWVAEGAVGEPRLLQADFGFRPDRDPEGRLFSPELAGGALLDIGVYPVSLSSWLMGPPEEVRTLGHLGETGVDEQGAVLLSHGGPRHSVLSFTFLSEGPTLATLAGTEGRIRIHRRWWSAEAASLVTRSGHRDSVERPFPGNGYQFQAAHVADCLRRGRTESPVMPLDESLRIMETLDRIRGEWGLRYPGEEGVDAGSD